ncbi:MAG: nucleotidyltransferase domain-containing protein [Thermoprotei archaeon]|nr:MAG: nucleotidyltransferase domain-containing protein [Thermoprotei archaeon]HDD64067.1 nucleotidyltransferase domain-containing protein [Thermoprotei archaeon]
MYLKIIKDTVRKMDPEAEVFLFGSVAEGKYVFSSDIDILIITNVSPGNVLTELWKKGIKDPFEIHVQPPEKLRFYSRKCKLVKV